MSRSLEAVIATRVEQAGPIHVAVIGAGACARTIVRHLYSGCSHVRLVGVANRTLDRARQVLIKAGEQAPATVRTEEELRQAVANDRAAVTDDPNLLACSPAVEVLVEATGTVEFAARVVLKAVEHRKHVVLVNAELDSTLGPILKYRADQAGVVLTHTDGEEPGVAMTLLRYVSLIGLRPVAAGNLKGLVDRYRTPETQKDFAAKHRMDPAKVASFADGTKLSMEATILANATGFCVGQRGMYGPKCAHVRKMSNLLPPDKLLSGGLVDYALGAEPHTGAFVIAYEDHPKKREELAYYKMGDGPFYVFYTPYHLPHIQIVSTIARAALFNDATVAPRGAPVCEVATVAKRDLNAGEILDGVGGFTVYGIIENASTFAAENLLPMGVAEGCHLLRHVTKDTPLTYADVELPRGRLCDSLRAEQAQRFGHHVPTESPAN